MNQAVSVTIPEDRLGMYAEDLRDLVEVKELVESGGIPPQYLPLAGSLIRILERRVSRVVDQVVRGT